ncbi:Crp/Fnr family transcriptional regulator [Bradyrhizobium sp.]|uniref:Crp/Fnr family transcriptional regulator n=1 Tax=Bradyrhizobium sp. TaxID=376 RepID=UPI001ED0A195|nr:Crp/Fnr family transcriptional regulator [Bradyrhizobium sp.]MBV8917278.1 Crp/Fnr family transcriptional regulator [Bradyrhizobium sp.]MBV9980529.1 Crp/Fnr family transcriptional regulator [Bradyrhizobium sp.]
MSIMRLDGGLTQPVVRRLNALRQLSETATAAFDKTIRRRVLHAGAGETLISEGERPDRIRVVLAGWLSRYKLLEDGRRQIVNFILPGEMCDAFSYLLPRSDHSIDTLTPVVFSEIEREPFEELIASDRSLMEALWCTSLVDGSIQREWAVNIGRRDALERVAHLLCEVFERLKLVGLVEGNSCAFPVTQMDLADASGLSIVHLNRTLQELRAAGLIILRERMLTINDLDALKDAGLFNPTYLPYLR